MTRGALLVSLALHAGFLAVVAGWSSGARSGSGDAGMVLSSTAGDTVESPLIEPEPAGTPEPPPLAPEPEWSGTKPDVADPMPVVTSTSESIPTPAPEQSAALAVSAAKAEPVPVKNAPAPKRTAAHSGGRKGEDRARTAAGDGNSAIAGVQGGGGGPGYVPPQYRLRYKPPYPATARAQHLEGTALLLVVVDRNGRVTGAELRRSSGHAALDQAALEAVRSWRFEPARQNGVATDAKVEVPVGFRFG